MSSIQIDTKSLELVIQYQIVLQPSERKFSIIDDVRLLGSLQYFVNFELREVWTTE